MPPPEYWDKFDDEDDGDEKLPALNLDLSSVAYPRQTTRLDFRHFGGGEG